MGLGFGIVWLGGGSRVRCRLGAILSEDEISQKFLAGCSRPEPASFKFTYPGLLGEFQSYHYCHEDDMNKKLLFFPSRLNHSVNPFYSTDEVRISVSGNLDFKK